MLHKNIMKHIQLLCFSMVCFFLHQTATANEKICKLLILNYHEEDARSYLAEADGVHDDSVHRANLRELGRVRLFLGKLVILQLMEKHGCAFPEVLRKNYFIPATACVQKSGSCDMNTWKSLGDLVEEAGKK